MAQSNNMYIFTGEEVVATELVPNLNDNFAKTIDNLNNQISTNTLKTVNSVAKDANGNVNVKSLIPTSIANSTNLNNITTSGEYLRTASTTVTNSPTTKAFFLTVLKNGTLIKQVLTEVDGTDPLTFTRTYTGSAWSPWVEGGKVKTVDSVTPDSNGNVSIYPKGRTSIGSWHSTTNYYSKLLDYTFVHSGSGKTNIDFSGVFLISLTSSATSLSSVGLLFIRFRGDTNTLNAARAEIIWLSTDFGERGNISDSIVVAYDWGTSTANKLYLSIWFKAFGSWMTMEAQQLIAEGGDFGKNVAIWTPYINSTYQASLPSNLTEVNVQRRLPGQYDTGIWQANEAVAVGTRRYLYGRGNAGILLECVKAGTTGTAQPTIASSDITDTTSSFEDLLFSLPHTTLSHNSMYRGKNLGTITSSNVGTFITEHGVNTGAFKDVWVGDYLTIQDGTYNAVWLVAGLDTEYNRGDAAFTSHHITLIPRGYLTVSYMNATNITTGGYVGSYMYTTKIPEIVTNLSSVLGDHLLTRRALLTNSVNTTAASGAGAGWTGSSNNWAWYDVRAVLPSEVQIYGSTVFSSSGYDAGDACNILPLYNFRNHVKDVRSWFWLKCVASGPYFCCANGSGVASAYLASYVYGVRPLIWLG